MPRTPDIVRTAGCVLDKFVSDWRDDFFCWYREADVQAELATRLRRALRVIDDDRVEANYRYYQSKKRRIPTPHIWSRVECGAPVRYGGSLTRPKLFRPDLILWADLTDKNHPPDERGAGIGRPVWVCELKCNSSGSINEDIDKVTSMIKHHPPLSQYGACMELMLARPYGRFRTEVIPSYGGRFRLYRVRLDQL